MKHSWRVLERLERAIAYTLENVATEPETDGSIIGLSSLNSNVKPIQDSLFEDAQEKISESNQQKNSIQQSSVPAWALAAGTQPNLTGLKAEEAKPNEKSRPISRSETPQETLPGLPENLFLQHFPVLRENYTGTPIMAYLPLHLKKRN